MKTISTGDVYKRQGIMTADTIVLGAHDVQNTGRIDGRKVNIKASQNVINTGNIHGDKQVTINAGRDINVGAHVDRLEHHDIVSRQGTIGVEMCIRDRA